MTIETALWDTADFLESPADMKAYLEAVLADGDPSEIQHALGVVARAKGMSQVARDAGVTREALYKALSAKGDPKLSTVLGVLKALGVRLSLQQA
jgi:probable addiction module antidote protein